MATELNLGYQQRLAELDAMVAEARLSPDSLCERAAGLLAGRIGCRIDEAHAHLRLLAGQQEKSVDTVAEEVIITLEPRQPTSSQRLLRTAEEALRAAHRGPGTRSPHSRPAATAEAVADGWADVVQQMLNTVPGDHVAVAALRNGAEEIVDYRLVAVSPAMRDLSGRAGLQLVGRRVGDVYPD